MDTNENEPERKPDLDPTHELPIPHDMELPPPNEMELPPPHDMLLKPHFTHKHPWLHWTPALFGLLIGIFIGIFLTQGAPENRQQINQYYKNTPPVVTKAQKIETDSGWKPYTHSPYSYSLLYPAQWNIKESMTADSHIINFEEKNSNYAGWFQIINHPYKSTLSLDAWAKQYHIPLVADPKTSLATFVGDITIKGLPAKEFSVFGFDHSRTQIFTIHNNYMYIIEFESSNGNDPNFSEHSKIYKTMLDSLTFENPTAPLISKIPSPITSTAPTVCTLDIKKCPDGYFVNIVAPTGDFLPCTIQP